MPVIKEDETYVVIGSDADPWAKLRGVIFQDTVYLSGFAYDLGEVSTLHSYGRRNTWRQYAVRTREDRAQRVGFERNLNVNAHGVTDTWTLTNTTDAPEEVTIRLVTEPVFCDLFALARDSDIRPEVNVARLDGDSVRLFAEASDGVCYAATISAPGLADDLSVSLTLAPRGEATVVFSIELTRSDDDRAGAPPLPSYGAWADSFSGLVEACGSRPGLTRAIDDTRALLLRTAYGPYPAAGAPVFVNLFGRDALITAMMLQYWRSDALKAVISFLADHLGDEADPAREEEPGKVLHELRRGELARTNRIPFGPYYGSVDSTPLFLMALGQLWAAPEHRAFVASLVEPMGRAATWLLGALDGGGGLARFQASGTGLAVQSWKDSPDSMNDEHGRPAVQPLAVAEVQGYAYAALNAVAVMLADDVPELARQAGDGARTLRAAFHERFWLEDMDTYAMALDADGQPLRVLSSDPGHLLWSGIVPADVAPRLVRTMMGDALWSGWGVRTLGADEATYNPVSYHNGSVWPHDTALLGLGLARYGFREEAHRVAHALLDLADASPYQQIPELIAGHTRVPGAPPVAYTHANAPQSWAAAGVIAMAGVLTGTVTATPLLGAPGSARVEAAQ